MANRIQREYQFVPRIINPVKIGKVFFFAADAQLRESRKVLDEKMPWLRTEILDDPQSVVTAVSEGPSVFLFDDTGMAILDVEKVRLSHKKSVLVLLSFQPFIHCAPPQSARQRYPHTAGADLIFAVNNNEFPPESIILPAVRAAEDLINIDERPNLKRFIFHIVDDEPRWFSQFLPVLHAIIGQRADVMITRTYEESLQFLFGSEDEAEIGGKERIFHGHGDDVVCLITDIFFPRGNELQSDAGRDLIRLVNRYHPRIPVIIASKAKEALELSDLGFVLPKGDPGSLQKLRDHILNTTGLGDFLIQDDEGQELYRAKNIQEIYQILGEAERNTERGRRLRAILESYGEKDRFSTWLYMHSYRELGERLRLKKSRGRQMIALLKRSLEEEIARLERVPLVLGRRKIFDLPGLLESLRSTAPGIIQPFSDNDVLSSWLDRKGYSGLAEELRPVHGSGSELKKTLVDIVAKWLDIYGKTDET